MTLTAVAQSPQHPFDKWTTAVASDDDIVRACEQAARQPIERLAGPARAEVRRRLRLQPAVAEATDVIVRRSKGGQLDATIRMPEEAENIDDELAVAVAGVLRAEDRFASRVNVAVERVPRPALTPAGPSA